jgi:YbbR domain-containing protein
VISALTSLLTENLPIKLLAVLLGLVVYAHVYTEQEVESEIAVPLRVTGLPPGLVLDEPLPATVDLSLRAKGKQILKLKIDQPEILVDLSGAAPGKIQRMLSPTDVVLPVGAQVTITGIVDPKMVMLSIDTLVSRTLPVRPVLEGELPESALLLAPPEVRPSRVTAVGGSAIVNALEFLETAPLDLGGVKESVDRELAVTAVPDVRVDPARVRVFLAVARQETRVLYPVPVQVEGLGARLAVRVEPDSAAVAVWGVRESLDSLDRAAVGLVLDASGLGPGRHLMAPQFRLAGPAGVRLRWVRPARFLVEIGRRGS